MQVTGVLPNTSTTDDGTLNFANTAAHTFSGAISGSGALWKTAGGSMTLNAANTFTGVTTVSNGTLVLGSAPPCRTARFPLPARAS